MYSSAENLTETCTIEQVTLTMNIVFCTTLDLSCVEALTRVQVASLKKHQTLD